jgi:acyl dehydratase
LRLPQVKFVEPLLPGEVADIVLERLDPQQARARWRFRVLRGETLLASGDVVQP